ncbi:hypothetical protein JYQ62_11330 [Nostoc sp. UHCC 0702]|nr:hypothetical protein JYQ62_11330 [Nostoc sp. UHCC 0702]
MNKLQMISIYQKLAVAAAITAFSLTLIKANSAQAIQIIPSGYQVEEISTGSFELVQASGLALDTNNNIYVARNFFNGSSDLLKITPSGNVSSIASFNTFIGGLAINKSQQVFGALFDGSVFQLQDENVSYFATGLPSTLEKLAFDQNNNLFVASFSAGTVSKITPEGSVTTFVSGLSGPFGVAFKGESLFIGDNLNGGVQPGIIREVTPLGSVTTFLSPIPGRIVDLEYELTSDSFFVANQGVFVNGVQLPGTIDLINNGQITTFATGFLGGSDVFPRELEFDSKGNLYVTDAQKLYKISKSKLTTIPEPTSVFAVLIFGFLGAGSVLKKKM